MSSYSGKRVLSLSVLSSLITVLVGFVFVETAYQSLRGSVRSWIVEDPAVQMSAREELRRIVERRDLRLSLEEQNKLMKLWHDLGIGRDMWYLGITILKNPADLWMMQQIMFEVRPDYVIETGTFRGGSALYWAHILDGLGLEKSRVITIDIEDYTAEVSKLPLWQKYVEFIHSSSTDPATVARIAERVNGKTVLVTLDSNHAADHVLDELRAYGPMVSPGSYIVVEDTHIDGVPVLPRFGPGPMAGLLAYKDEGGSELFEPDVAREAFVLTFNPGGWLRRKTVVP